MVSTTPHNGPRSAGGSRTPVARRTRLLYAAAGAVAILVGWQLLTLVVSPVIMASPADTAKALARLAWGSTLWVQLLITLKRLVVGLAVGAAVGWVLGILAGIEPRVRSFLEPMRWVGMTIPAVIIAAFAMLWFGLGDFAVMFLVALIVMPTMFVNTVAGVLAIDSRLTEMGRVYHFPRRLMLAEVYLPGIASPAMAGLTLATGIAVRAVVLGEVLGAMSGIGHAFTRAMSYLETPEMFAWVVVLLALMAVIEFGVLRPLKKRVMRWRKVAG
jgi:NitT/TauT family transport system permease protein